MADGALRSVFAELGIDFDEKSLQKANSLVDKAVGNVQKLVASTGKADQVEALFAARQKARAAARHEHAVQSAADAAKASGGNREVGLFGKLRELATGDAKARDEARKAELDRAHTLAARQALGGAAPAFNPFGKDKAQGATSFGGKLGTEQWKAAAKPVETYIDLLNKADEAATKWASGKLGRYLDSIARKFPALNAALDRFGLGSTNTAGRVRALLGVTAGAALVFHRATSAAFAFADAFSAQSEQLRETAREARVTSSELQEFQHAGAQSGVGADRMAAGVAKLGQSLRAASLRAHGGGGGLGFTLRRLGIEMRDSGGRVRSTSAIMDQLAVAMEHIESPARRVRVATELFGESGRRMLDVLHTGPGGLRALRDEMEALGGGVSADATAAAHDYTLAQERLKVGADSLRSVIAVGLLPALSWVVNKGAELAGWWARLTHGTHIVQVGLIGLGVAGAAVAASLVIAWAPVIAPFVVAAAKIAVVALALDDLWTFVEGGDSALGRFIDSMFGVGTSAQYAHELREEWEAVQNAIAGAIAKVAEWTGIGEVPSIGTLAPPRTDGRPSTVRTRAGGTRANPVAGRRGGARVTSAGATVERPESRPPAAIAAAPAVVAVAVPASRQVSAPGVATPPPRGARRVTRSTTNHFHMHGATNEDLVRQTSAEVARLQRAERDAEHPLEDDDG